MTQCLFRLAQFFWILLACSVPPKAVDKNFASLQDRHGQENLVAHTFVWEEGNYSKEKFRAPDYDSQSDKLGWHPQAFQVAPGLEKAVGFWQKIYQQYDSHQGVLHDSFHIDLIYKEIDFHPIMATAGLSDSERLEQRRRLVEAGKNEVREALRKIAAKEPLDPFAQKLAQKLQALQEPNLLERLPEKGRLRFQLGQKDYIEKGFFHSGAYMRQLEAIFDSYALPRELVRIAFVESSFNLQARSKVGASGIWQIMPATARGKLPMDFAYDYRNHPLQASHTAAQLLKQNYRVLGDWPRALTAYNYGAAGMQRLSKKWASADIAQLARIRDGRWGFAAANFYASFLALLDTEQKIMKRDPAFYWRTELHHEALTLPHAISWSFFADQLAESKDFRTYNPQFRYERLRAEPDSVLPKGLKIYFPNQQLREAKNLLAKAPQAKAPDYRWHQVQRGESLGAIARRYEVSVKRIAQLNQLKDQHFLRAGQRLKIPK